MRRARCNCAVSGAAAAPVNHGFAAARRSASHAVAITVVPVFFAKAASARVIR
jgi:hypothetical protein